MLFCVLIQGHLYFDAWLPYNEKNRMENNNIVIYCDINK